jgi:hypothetical protein
MSREIGFACQASLALAIPDQAGFAGARGTGGDVTFGAAA